MTEIEIEDARVSDSFIRPCLVCGVTVRTVRGEEQPHDCRRPESDAEALARAWWAGYDAHIGGAS